MTKYEQVRQMVNRRVMALRLSDGACVNEIAERAVLLADATIAALNKERGE